MMKWFVFWVATVWTLAAQAMAPGALVLSVPYDPPTQAVINLINGNCNHRVVSAQEKEQLFYTRVNALADLGVWNGLIAFHDWNAYDWCSASIDRKNPELPVTVASFAGSMTAGIPSLHVANIVGQIQNGMLITGPGIPDGMTIVGQVFLCPGCGQPGGNGTYKTSASPSSNTSGPMIATAPPTSSSLVAYGDVTFYPYAGVQSDGCDPTDPGCSGNTGWLLGPVWDSVINSINSPLIGTGVCTVTTAISADVSSGIMGIEAVDHDLLLLASNIHHHSKVTGQLNNSIGGGIGIVSQSGATCWDNQPGGTNTDYYQFYYGSDSGTLALAYTAPSTDNYALLGNAGSNFGALYSNEPDLYHTIQPHQNTAWYGALWQAFVRAGGRTGALSVYPNGPIGSNNAFGPPTIPTPNPSTLQMAYSGSCPTAGNTDTGWPGWPAVFVVQHNNCAGNSWEPDAYNAACHGAPNPNCGVVYLIFDPSCTVGNCNPRQGTPNTPNPIDGAPTDAAGNVVRLGYASIPDSNSIFYATLQYLTGQPITALPTATFTGSITSAGSSGTLSITSGSLSGTLTIGQTLSDGIVGGSTNCTAYTTNSVPCGTFVTGQIDSTDYSIYVLCPLPPCSLSIPSKTMTSLIPTFTAGPLGTFHAALAAPQVPFNLVSNVYSGTTFDIPGGTTYQSPEEFLVLPINTATGSPPDIATNMIEIDEERGDNCSPACLINEYATNPTFNINSVISAGGFKFNFRCDQLGLSSGNAALSGCTAASIPTIRGLSQFNKQLILMTPTSGGVVSSFFAQAAISNGDATGTNPPSCSSSSFYTQTGIRVLLSNLSPTDWNNLNTQVLSPCPPTGSGAGVSLLEDAPNGQRLGGEACVSPTVPVLNPEKWALGGGFGSTYPCFGVNLSRSNWPGPPPRVKPFRLSAKKPAVTIFESH